MFSVVIPAFGLMPRAGLQRLRKWGGRESHEVVHLPSASDIR
jgi:hypothetical protein